MILTWRSPAQSRFTFLWASRNSWSRPGFTRKRTALNAVIGRLPSLWNGHDARGGAARARPLRQLLASPRKASDHGLFSRGRAMSQTVTAPRTKITPKIARPPLWKVILLNDDYTPREFVVVVLKAVFRMSEEQAYNVMITAHRRGACVIAVFAKDVADTKAKEATELGKSKGYPLFFTTEPEE